MQPAARSDHGQAGEGPVEHLDARAPDPLIGRVVADRYRIVGHLGRGGMGVVYKVEHLRIGKLMAMKLLSGELSRNKEVVRRFKREALAASRLTSINTVQVWDFGHSDGLTYLVMELVAGEDLGRILKREGPMPFRRVAQIAVQVCNSMIEAHERGIVHRDIKPENILIVHPGGHAPDRNAKSDGVQDLVKVLDFGLAKLHDEERPHTNEVTTTGAIVGTPFYMSPEQIRGEPVDGRADLYALGAVMYRAITGVPPFTATTPMAVLTQHLTETLVPPHERAPELGIPREASDIVARAMAKERDERFASAVELREALIQYLVELGVSSGFLRSGALEAVASPSLDPAALERIRPSRGGPERPVPATRREVRSWFRERRRRAFFGLVAVTAIALAGITIAIAQRGPDAGPVDAEREPNDTIAAANPLAFGTPKRAYLGKRLGPDRADVDWYRFEVPASDAAPLVEVGLAPLPNIPLCVELHADPSGRDPVATFCRPRGRPLHVAAFRVEPGPHWIRVTQDRGPSEEGARPPVHENVSDTYALRVALAPQTPDLEIEPNDGVASAQAIDLGGRVVARLGWRGDRDVFCAQPESAARLVVQDRTPSPGGHLVVSSALPGEPAKPKPLDPRAAFSIEVPAGQRRCLGVAARGDVPHADATYEISVVAP